MKRHQKHPNKLKQGIWPPSGRLVVGIHAVKEAIKVRPQAIESLYFRQKWQDSQDLRDLEELAQKHQVKTQEKPEGEMDKLYRQHQGVAAALSEDPELDWTDLKLDEPSIVVLVDGVEDPHNLGAILRTSWLMNVKAMFIREDRAVGMTPTVHKVACGGAEHVPVIVENHLDTVVSQLKELGFWVYGLEMKGSQSLYRQEFPDKVALVVGSESKGMRTQTAKSCDELVNIPQKSASASYNASVSVAVALGEICRQHNL